MALLLLYILIRLGRTESATGESKGSCTHLSHTGSAVYQHPG
ncbi:hypothetical protein S7335_1072 [Synechococcus sp. PCC 7335]|nr:hypothetical protein S7335_1072 [Synechococcus sp. PCC 7335]